MSKITKVLILMFLVSSTLSALSQDAIYVGTEKTSNPDGSINRPFLNFQDALNASRSKKIKKIIIASGNYYNVSITLTKEDSGLDIEAMSDTHPTLYGGTVLTNLTKEGKFISAQVPGAKTRAWDFRLITVNDSTRSRARLPETGAYSHLNQWKGKILPSSQGGYENKPTDSSLNHLIYQAGDINSAIVPENAELSIYHEWDESYVGVKSIDSINRQVNFSYNAVRPPGVFSESNPIARQYVVWNTKEGMTSPGQWFLDRISEKLYYWPFPEETISNITIRVPKDNHIITFGTGCSHVTVKGINLTLGSNSLQNEGYAGTSIDAAISGENSSNISLIDLSVKTSGGSGIKLKGNYNRLQNIELRDLDGAGIVCEGGANLFDSINIEKIGRLFYSAAGIIVSGSKNRITNCRIDQTPYSGIVITGGSSNEIKNCTVSNFLEKMQDGGGIYLGRTSNSIIENNSVFGHNSELKWRIGLYFDELCNSDSATRNLVINCGYPVHTHIATGIFIQENIFIDSSKQIPHIQDSKATVLAKNVFLANQFAGQSNSGTFNDPKSFLSNVVTTRSKLNNSNLNNTRSHQFKRENATTSYDQSNKELINDLFSDPSISGVISKNDFLKGQLDTPLPR